MAEFSGSIDTAYYVNEEYTLIEVVYTNPNGEKINYMVEVGDNADHKALIEEGYDLETLLERTSEYKRVHAGALGALVNEQAQALAEEMLGMKHMKELKAQLQIENEQLGVAQLKNKEKIEKTEKTLLSLDQDVKVKTNKIDHGLFDFIFSVNEDKEELFKFKLWALEQDVVKAADKKIKSSIRKAKRITEAMAILDSII
tara:strand:- start:246 stop:845 length:600 start_codon:yes stop_codon:yes gene_type:complete